MIYVALLRGINVGGNNKIDMKRLKLSFERLGLRSVKTYINTGNIIFQDEAHTTDELVELLEKVIVEDFGLSIKVLLRSLTSIQIVCDALPSHWVNNNTMKCDVMFLWEAVDSPMILDQLFKRKDIDDARYVSGAILWCVERENLTKSGMMKLAQTKLYKEMTVRNCNTVRKLFILMSEMKNTE